MGFLRVLAIVLLSILLFVSLIASNTLFVLGTSLKYDNVKAGLYPLVQDLSGTSTGANNILPSAVTQNVNITQYAQSATDQAKAFCQANPGYVYNYSSGGYSISIPCSSVNFSSSNSAQQIINQSLDSIVSAFYYKQYNCSFTQCFSTVNPPTFLVSEMSQQYFMGKFYLAVIVTLLLIALLFWAAQRKANASIIIGTLLIASGIFVSQVIKTVANMLGQFGSLLSIFLATANITFWFSLILGTVLLLTGIGFRIWHKPKETNKEKQKK
ncbi:MAG: hypothetical protein ABSG05_02700 [Candidatus Pacearchaeota archaeon]|jgi:hypothetical protein